MFLAVQFLQGERIVSECTSEREEVPEGVARVVQRLPSRHRKRQKHRRNTAVRFGNQGHEHEFDNGSEHEQQAHFFLWHGADLFTAMQPMGNLRKGAKTYDSLQWHEREWTQGPALGAEGTALFIHAETHGR